MSSTAVHKVKSRARQKPTISRGLYYFGGKGKIEVKLIQPSIRLVLCQR
jgi:hypothetical protein